LRSSVRKPELPALPNDQACEATTTGASVRMLSSAARIAAKPPRMRATAVIGWAPELMQSAKCSERVHQGHLEVASRSISPNMSDASLSKLCAPLDRCAKLSSVEMLEKASYAGWLPRWGVEKGEFIPISPEPTGR